jgi:hypothetical protein
MFSNLGFSVSKFWGVIHHSWRLPTPPVPHGYHSWGIADEIALGQIPTVGTSFILRLCNRWYSFIHSYSIQYCHSISSITPTSWGAIARHQVPAISIAYKASPPGCSLLPSSCLRLLSSLCPVSHTLLMDLLASSLCSPHQAKMSIPLGKHPPAKWATPLSWPLVCALCRTHPLSR